MSGAPDMLERAVEVRTDAVRHLTALAGDASMCAIGRSGRSFPAAKYHEGRQAAAGQLLRLLRQEPSNLEDARHDEIIERVTSQWRRVLDDAATKGPDWAAYASGGLDAVADVVEPRQ